MTEFIILPGIGGSCEKHWQTIWERDHSTIRRFRPTSWDHPDLADWIEALDVSVREAATAPMLVAHSLACLLVAHWSARSNLVVAGAFLVSVPDPSSPEFPTVEAGSFVDVPEVRLRFPSIVIASSDDPYGSLAYQRRRATEWGSLIVEVGAFGHINAASGVGDWSEGWRLLQRFAAETTGA